MIILKKSGETIIKVSIANFKKEHLEIWIEGAEVPIELKYSELACIS